MNSSQFHCVAMRLIMALILVAPLASNVKAAKHCHVLIIADTNDATIGDDVEVDASNVFNLFYGNVVDDQLTIFQLKGGEVSRDSILNNIRRINLARGVDTLVVYYAGHGGYDRNSGQFISPSGDAISRNAIRSAMMDKGARLNVLVTDTCSNYTQVTSKIYKTLAAPPETSPAFVSLCWKPEGFVDISGSKPGEVAMGDGAKGGYFTSSFCDYIESVRSSSSVDWPDVVRATKANLDRKFRSRHPNGLSIPQLGITQRTQTVYSSLDLASGGNFGVNPPPTRGVKVTQVFSNSTADHLYLNGVQVRLEVGDVIVSLNGRSIRTPQDFGRIVDGLGRDTPISLGVIDSSSGELVTVRGKLDESSRMRVGVTVNNR